ncbi:non-specific lipid transfer protein GPI-anchored 25 [Manihot esculenta]|uniref:non-specific lipid transfer protein GPI-anchored 25 n=1 Tax=Manihot esculenta TaxID=3983 RepID=UPI001CC3C347|nr:non-specific lipid transfer protein GPI-anchored 25 [Manihot esculenta]
MTAIFTSIFASTLLFATASLLPQSPPSCIDELVAFSSCLGYVSVAPNNLTDTATSQCCDAFSKAFNSRDGNCFCYLMRQPLIFGFMLNKSRLVSLPSVCSSVNGGSVMKYRGSPELICSGSPALPSLLSTTASVPPKPYDGPDVAPSSTSMPEENAETSPTPLSFTPEPIVESQATPKPLLKPIPAPDPASLGPTPPPVVCPSPSPKAPVVPEPTPSTLPPESSITLTLTPPSPTVDTGAPTSTTGSGIRHW